MTKFSGEEKPQVVLRFLGRPEQMSLNKTNALAIARQHGNDTDGWATCPSDLSVCRSRRILRHCEVPSGGPEVRPS